jgi:hypothetical protein
MTREVSFTAAGKLLISVMVNGPGGTVITTGDQLPAAFGFAAAHVAPTAVESPVAGSVPHL